MARYRSPTAFEFVEEECVDLSSGGMFIKSKAPAPAGTLLKLECELDHGLRTMRAVARVVWLRERESNDEPRGMGVKFVKLDPGGREMIATILERLGGNEGAGPQARSSKPPPPPDPLLAQANSLRPSFISQARIDPAAALTTSLIEVKPPGAPVSDPAPAPATSRSAEVVQQKSGKPKQQPPQPPAQAKVDMHARRSSAAPPRSDVPTHRPPPRGGLDQRSIAIGAAMLIGVAVIALVARRSPDKAAELTAEPAAQLAAEPSAPVAQSYLLRLSTLPSGARVAVGERSGTSPMLLDLGIPTSAIEVRAEKDGYEQVSTSIELDRFTEENGRRIATVTLALPPLPREAAAEQTNVNTVAQAPAPAAAPAPAPVATRAAAQPAAPSEKPRARSTKRAPSEQSASKPEAAAAPSAPAEPSAPVQPAALAAAEPAAPAVPAASAPAGPMASAAPAAQPAAPVAAPAPLTGGPLTPMQAARACLARSDSACAVQALEGRARTAQELELLVETYRSMGRSDAVVRNMQLYVERFPNERRAGAYSGQLGLKQPQ